MAAQSRRFDFDTWKKLAVADPDAFETRRKEWLDAEIESAPEDLQRRLRGLQWRIDATRRRYQHPLASSTKLFEMMWQQVYGENGFLDALTKPGMGTTSPHSGPGKVVVLHRRR